MAGRYLLDTNVVIALFDGHVNVREAVDDAREVFLSSIVVGELYFGAFSSQRMSENQARLESFANSVTTLACDRGTAVHFGQIKNQQRAAGRPIPENDLRIAATARQHGLTLVSRDEHFRIVDRLRVESW